MGEPFWEVFPVIIIFPTFAIMLKWFLEYRIRQRLIEKGMVDEKIRFLNSASLGQATGSSLKWGMVLVLTGLAIFIVQMYDVSGEMILAIMLIAAGAGLLLYYLIADHLGKKRIQE
ncbi:MAG: hypothetical protein PHR28_13725 [candidate division Zixibacteria bacterium]|nr:hypothetical protein [candidate division Zixibacteria bacterium]